MQKTKELIQYIRKNAVLIPIRDKEDFCAFLYSLSEDSISYIQNQDNDFSFQLLIKVLYEVWKEAKGPSIVIAREVGSITM